MKRPLGFTMVDVLIAVAIMVFLSLMLIGGTSTMMGNIRFSSSTEKVISSLNLARNLAITHNAIYHVRIQNFMLINGKDDLQQAIGIYCYPSSNEALNPEVSTLDRLTGLQVTSDETQRWSNRTTLTPPPSAAAPVLFRNYRVSYVPLEKGIYFGIQGVPSATTPSAGNADTVIFFLPDGTASQSLMLFVTNDPVLADTPVRYGAPPQESAWAWQDRNGVRRALHDGLLSAYAPPPAPTDGQPVTDSVSLKLSAKSAVNFIQVYQGGMIRFLKQGQQP